MGRSEIVIGSILAALSALAFGLTYSFPSHTLAFSPKVFPRFVSACLFILSGILILQGASALRAGRRSGAPVQKKPTNWPFLLKMALAALIGYAYTRFLSTAGYLAATPFFIAGIMLLFKERNWLKVLSTAVLTTGLLYILFRIVFRVPLPRFGLF